MAQGDNWSAEECDIIVADYFAMLRDEQAGRQYNKAAHRKALMQRVDRANGSIEFKHCNITAVLEELGMKGIDGYKPRPNYQNSLLDAIERYLERTNKADLIAIPEAVGPELRLVEAPPPSRPNAPVPAELERMVRKFDPVELDLELRVAPGVERRFRVPDALDHGYDLFDIWIEEPRGERRKLRSPRIYCSPLKTRTITPAAPFRRDISIFGEAGGYAFRKAGLHAVWAEFEPRPGHKLVSNRLEVHVRGRGCEDEIQDERAMLANSKAAQTLYHRLPIAKPKQLGDLAEFARTAKLQSRGAIAYGLGRAMLHGASAKAKAEASDLLARAAQEKVLGDHQRAIAFELTERG